MRKRILTAVLSVGLLAGSTTPALALSYHRQHDYYDSAYSSAYRRHVRHKRHMATAKRVGVGAAGGAAIGALAHGGKGAGIGAIAGAGAGYLWDRHQKHTGHY
ncbi:MAG TPA: YMGG-like glycine zipper-containing protein [Candidatus Acidoferrales bacterium]|jgi:hypothetical protein|nr:YMGG-like glycine zipper-containing protein [Candidatus Acidoferrales bacterium]